MFLQKCIRSSMLPDSDTTMEGVLSRLQTLTPDQLRQETMGAGLKCGPITATTRAIFERRLARALVERGGADLADSSSHQDPPVRGEGADSDPSPDLKPSEAGVTGEAGPVPCEEAEGSQPECPTVYYGVCPQTEESPGETGKVRVYVDRKKALRAMIPMKGARFKAFSTREEAEKFAKGSNEQIPPSPGTNAPDVQQGILESVTDAGRSVSGEPSAGNPEKANEFRSPRTQDLTAKLRKAVEDGDQAAFSSLVWANPRYLIGSGDNPTIVHEGCHYNVLHVAAKENQAGLVQLLLDTLESPDFMRLMYPDDQEAMLHQRICYLVDLYLNTPDRTNNETPLHFACKFGCPEVVNVLCSHPATDKHRRNKYGQMPSNVVCDRKNKSPLIKKTIRDYLEDRCYVPLLRDADNSFQPVIGLPWSPTPLELDFNSLDCGAAGSPIDPVMTVRAYVGPLSPSKADEFYKLWRTPPRVRGEYFHHILKSDPDRGVERVGREIAHDMGHPWAEYWDFLDSFVDLSSDEGLRRLEDYLEKRNEDDQVPSDAEADEPRASAAVSGGSSPPTEESAQSPACNLLPEFERAATPDGSGTAEDQGEAVNSRAPSAVGPEGVDLADGSFWRTWRRGEGRAEEELSSTCSEEYLTADEGSEHSAGHGEDDERDGRRRSVSSGSSYASTRDTSEITVLAADTPTRSPQFIDGHSPTKLDREVLAVVKDLEIDPERHPCTTKWRETILAYSLSQRQSWPSPMGRSFKEPGNSTPDRLSSPWRSGPSGLPSPGFQTPTKSTYTQHILCRAGFRSPN